MSFIISKNSKRHGVDRKVYYLVENYRDKGKVKRRTLLKLHEEGNIQVILEKLTRNEKVLRGNVRICENKLIKLERKNEDPNFYFAKLGVDIKMRKTMTMLGDVLYTKKGIKKILKKHPLSSARNSKLH